MSAITTHVLDTVLGKPGAGIAVRLERMPGGSEEIWIGEDDERAKDTEWVEIARGATDADGRCRDLAPEAKAGVYRLTFETGAYFRSHKRSSIYPEISITVNIGADAHYHLPLLLSDNSYTTYRGS